MSQPETAAPPERFNFAPLVIGVIASLVPGHKVPEQEQLLSAGCVCFSLLQAANALGYGAQWLTGWAAYDGVVTQRLGLGPEWLRRVCWTNAAGLFGV